MGKPTRSSLCARNTHSANGKADHLLINGCTGGSFRKGSNQRDGWRGPVRKNSAFNGFGAIDSVECGAEHEHIVRVLKQCFKQVVERCAEAGSAAVPSPLGGRFLPG